MIYRIVAAVVMSMLLWVNCGVRVAGTETETHTGTVTGSIVHADSTDAGAVPVLLHLLCTDTPVTFETQTSSDGTFTFDELPVGEYFVEVVEGAFGAAERCMVTWNDTTRLKATMAKTGVITGKLCIPFLDRILKVSATIREVNRAFTIDSSGYFVITALPAFNGYTLELQTLNIDDVAPFKIIAIDLSPGDTVHLGNIALFTGNVRVHASRVTGDSAAVRAEVMISGRDMLPMTEVAEIRSDEVYTTMSGIPEGLDRILIVSLYDTAGATLFSGADTVDILADSTTELTIDLLRVTHE